MLEAIVKQVSRNAAAAHARPVKEGITRGEIEVVGRSLLEATDSTGF